MGEKRRFPRRFFSDAVALKTRPDSPYQGCLGCDLSPGGLRFLHHDFLSLGQEVFLQIHVGPESLWDVRGKVIWSSQQPHAENYMVGVEFLQPVGEPDKRSSF